MMIHSHIFISCHLSLDFPPTLNLLLTLIKVKVVKTLEASAKWKAVFIFLEQFSLKTFKVWVDFGWEYSQTTVIIWARSFLQTDLKWWDSTMAQWVKVFYNKKKWHMKFHPRNPHIGGRRLLTPTKCFLTHMHIHTYPQIPYTLIIFFN